MIAAGIILFALGAAVGFLGALLFAPIATIKPKDMP